MMMVLRAQRTKRIQAQVAERVRAGQCLGTNRLGAECTEPAVKVGLCIKCYNAMHHATRGMDDVARAAYHQRLIAAGRLLARNEVCRLKNQSIYQRMAQ